LLFEEIHHWTARKMKEEGWELPQESRNNLSQ